MTTEIDSTLLVWKHRGKYAVGVWRPGYPYFGLAYDWTWDFAKARRFVAGCEFHEWCKEGGKGKAVAVVEETLRTSVLLNTTEFKGDPVLKDKLTAALAAAPDARAVFELVRYLIEGK